MGFVEKRNGRYRARYRDPLGRQRCETFTRKADAERYLRQMQVDIEWGPLDRPQRSRPGPRRVGRGVPLAGPAAVAVDPGHLPAGPGALHPSQVRRLPAGPAAAGEIENWLNDEIAAGLAPSSVHRHYRTLRRMLQVAVEKEKISSNRATGSSPPGCPSARWCS